MEGQVRTTVEELLKVIAIKNVIGEPIETEDKVLIPVTKIGIGFGTGSGTGKGNGGEGTGAGVGAGSGVSPVSLIVVLKGVKGAEGIKVLPLTSPSMMSRALTDIATAVVESMKGRREARSKEGGGGAQPGEQKGAN